MNYNDINQIKIIIGIIIYLIYSNLFESVTSIVAPFGFNSIVLWFPKQSSIFNVKSNPKFSAPLFSL